MLQSRCRLRPTSLPRLQCNGTAICALAHRPPLRRSFVYPKEGVFQPNSPPRPDLFPEPGQPTFNPPPPPKQNRLFTWQHARWALYATALGAGAAVAEISIKRYLSPEAPPEPGTPEDEELLAYRWDELQHLPQYQLLHAHSQFHSPDAEWHEWTAYAGLEPPDTDTDTDADTDADTSTPASRKDMRLTSGALAGSRGLALQQLFWSDAETRLVLFVNFGRGTAGWPGVVHGGAMATVCDEALGRVALRCMAAEIGASGVTANLTIDFLHPVHPEKWYILVADLDPDRDSTASKKYVVGQLRPVDRYLSQNLAANVVLEKHQVNLQARALFVAPKGLKLTELEEDF